ncbi:hypothetical protein chiPu_0013733 [Chiloscyllium punctatum]|uniref:Uncharacterized protein n=1 Tax=Chiloscyllium punctatum TaxID=137246 RepID=A0A401SXZ2_CHIPU|nr:hypothetical protein [Chiloscyllium punctatum]
MDEMSNRSEERIAVMPPVHSNDQNPTEIVNKDDHLYLEDEGLNKNPRMGYNAAAAPIESTIPDTELTKDSERQQGGPSENVEEPVNSMHPNQLQQNALTERELEHQEENAHMETIFSSDSSNEDVSTTNNMFEEVPPGLEENCGHQNDRNTTGPEGDNNVNMATLATVADIQQSKDAALQQDNTLKIKEDMDENKEENAMTEKLCCKDIYNDIKPTDEANAESSRQPPQNGAQENSKNVSESDNDDDANLSTVADIPQSGDVDRQQDNPLEISEEDVDKVSSDNEDDANLSTGDDIPESKDAERQQNNPLELSTEDVYKHELDNVQITPTCPSPVRNPRPIGLLQEENISSGGPSSNMLPDGMSIPFGTAVKAKGPEADDGSKLNEFLRNVSEYDLQALTTHFKQRLKDAVEEFGQQLVVNLLSKQLISDKESEHSRRLIKEKCKSEASKFIFDKVRTIGFVAVKTMWEICVNVDGVTPKLNEIRKDLLKKESDLQVFTTDYRKSLEDAVDEFGQHVALNLLNKCFITDKESEYMRKMIHEKRKSEAFQLILDKVTVNGIGAKKIMWETCLKMNDTTPKLSKIRNDLLKYHVLLNRLTSINLKAP